jgi:hypothetical protein
MYVPLLKLTAMLKIWNCFLVWQIVWFVGKETDFKGVTKT